MIKVQDLLSGIPYAHYEHIQLDKNIYMGVLLTSLLRPTELIKCGFLKNVHIQRISSTLSACKSSKHDSPSEPLGHW